MRSKRGSKEGGKKGEKNEAEKGGNNGGETAGEKTGVDEGNAGAGDTANVPPSASPEAPPRPIHELIQITLRRRDYNWTTLTENVRNAREAAEAEDGREALRQRLEEYQGIADQPNQQEAQTARATRLGQVQAEMNRVRALNNAAANNRTEAVAKLEDFLYYQKEDNRALRKQLLKYKPPPTEAQKKKAENQPPKPKEAERVPRRNKAFELGSHAPDAAWLKYVVNQFDKKVVGTLPGTVREDQNEVPYFRSVDPILPGELHLWTPRPRRMPYGFGTAEAPAPLPRRELRLDLHALEEHRRNIEDRTGATDSDPEMTHSRRRRQELAMTNTLLTARQELPEGRYTRTATGLWISAAETSADWLTSYDCLGPVMSSWISLRHQNGVQDIWNKGIRAGHPTSWRMSTAWAEGTTGRRERHAHEGLSPSSPVNSPPHSPIQHTNDHRIPCDVPAPSFDLPEDDPEIQRHKNYRNKCIYHYPAKSAAAKNVPYAPTDLRTDVAELSKPPEKRKTVVDDPEMDEDAGGKRTLKTPAPDGFAMNMYREIVEEKYGKDYDKRTGIVNRPDDEPDESVESDDEGDLFTKAYREDTPDASENGDDQPPNNSPPKDPPTNGGGTQPSNTGSGPGRSGDGGVKDGSGGPSTGGRKRPHSEADKDGGGPPTKTPKA